MKRTAFDLFHPVVAFGYFAVMFALSMTAMQPVYLAISLASVLSYSAVLRGWRATGRSLLWQLPLVAVVALANPLFSASGSTPSCSASGCARSTWRASCTAHAWASC